MDKKKKRNEGNLKVAICLAQVAFLCWLIISPLKANACGWFGEGQYDDDDSVSEETELSPVFEKDDKIIDPTSQTKTGNLFRKGDGVEKNYVKAVYWYSRAANQGFAGAQNNLAVMYEKGLGGPKNKSEAAKWYQKEAEQNKEKAQHRIEKMYLDGEGVPQNFEKAAKWISKAAEQSHNGAFRDMGEMYWKGLGVSQNKILAYMWWKLGALHGDKESERLLDIAAAKMKSSHVNEAKKLAQEGIQKHE